MIGVTVLVVDRDPRVRELMVRALRTAGMHALGAYVPADAVALLDGIAADVVLVRSDDEDAARCSARSAAATKRSRSTSYWPIRSRARDRDGAPTSP